MIEYRRTKIGKFYYYLGKLIAVYYIARVLLAFKQLLNPVYQQRSHKDTLLLLGSENDSIFLAQKA